MSEVELAVEFFCLPVRTSARTAFIIWHHKYQENPDLDLGLPLSIGWYEREASPSPVAMEVEQHGVLLFRWDEPLPARCYSPAGPLSTPALTRRRLHRPKFRRRDRQ